MTTNVDLSVFLKKLQATLSNSANNGKIAKINSTTGLFDYVDPSTLGSGSGGGTTVTTTGTAPFINLASLNLSATLSNTALTSALNSLAGKTVVVDKMYTVTGGSFTVPANTTLIGDRLDCGFKLTVAGTLAHVNGGVRISNLTLDGNKAGITTGSYGFGNALTRVVANASRPVYFDNCVYLNAGGMAVYGNTCKAGIYVTRNLFDGINQNVIMTQRSENVYFNNNRVVNSIGTVQFHGHDSQDTFTISKNFRCMDNVMDMTGVSLAKGATVLFIETWGNVEDVVIHGNRLLAPLVDNSNTVFGISIDHSRYVTVSANYVDGGPTRILGFGLEAAGSIDTIYRDNTVIGYKGFAVSVSRTDTRNIKIINNLFQNARSDTSGRAIQLIDGIKDVLVEGNTFRDFGKVGMHFNGCGTGTQVINNRFYILTQSYAGTCMQIQGAARVAVKDNVAGPETQVGVTNAAGYIKSLVETDSTTFSTFSGNLVDGMIANGTVAGSSSFGVLAYSNCGNNIYSDNVFANLSCGIQTETGTSNGNLISRNRAAVSVGSLVVSKNTSDKVVALLN